MQNGVDGHCNIIVVKHLLSIIAVLCFIVFVYTGRMSEVNERVQWWDGIGSQSLHDFIFR